MSSLNKIVLVGRCLSDADLKATTDGSSLARFTLDVARPARQDGGPSGSDHIMCVAWRDLAETCGQFKQEQQVLIEGRVITRTYDDDDGKRHYITEVEVRDAKSLGSVSDAPVSRPAATPSAKPVASSPKASSAVETSKTQVSEKDFDFTPFNSAENDDEDVLGGELEESIPF